MLYNRHLLLQTMSTTGCWLSLTALGVAEGSYDPGGDCGGSEETLWQDWNAVGSIHGIS